MGMRLLGRRELVGSLLFLQSPIEVIGGTYMLPEVLAGSGPMPTEFLWEGCHVRRLVSRSGPHEWIAGRAAILEDW